jgi:hypothetical protein
VLNKSIITEQKADRVEGRRSKLTRVGQIQEEEAHSSVTLLRATQVKNHRDVRRDDQHEDDAEENDQLEGRQAEVVRDMCQATK